jgi:hypothetical protein
MIRLSNHRQSLNLVHSTFLKFIILMQFLRWNNFDCIFKIGFYIFATIYFSVVTLADDLKQGVVINHLDHLF